jgi:hypothetical protein
MLLTFRQYKEQRIEMPCSRPFPPMAAMASGPGQTADMADEFHAKDRVKAAHDLDAVPAGTGGKVVAVTGLSWIRYRVRFDNGVELNLLDGRHLVGAS